MESAQCMCMPLSLWQSLGTHPSLTWRELSQESGPWMLPLATSTFRWHLQAHTPFLRPLSLFPDSIFYLLWYLENAPAILTPQVTEVLFRELFLNVLNPSCSYIPSLGYRTQLCNGQSKEGGSPLYTDPESKCKSNPSPGCHLEAIWGLLPENSHPQNSLFDTRVLPWALKLCFTLN